MRKHVVTFVLVLAAAAVLWFSYTTGGTRTAAGEESFGGTDAQVTSMLEAEGARPWFSPVVELGSAELESGLFAAQAAVGGIVLGYCVGRLHSRNRRDASRTAPVAT